MIYLSIHLITFNNEKHIEATIDSILKQKVNFNYEIVVGDDCSTDDTLSIIQKYKNMNPTIFKVFKNESQLGILKNFKSTLDKCCGNFVLPLAGDDVLKHENALKKIVETIDKDESLGFVDCGFDKYYENSKKTIRFANKKSILFDKLNYKKAVLLGEIVPIGICFNRKLLLKHVDFNTYMNNKITIEDYPVLVDLVKNTNFETIKESLVIYRIHDNSFSHNKDFKKQYDLAIQMKTLFDYFSQKYDFDKNLIEIYNKKHLKQLLFYAGFFEKKDLGKDVFFKIKSKNMKDYIHFWASQNKLFRRLVSIF